MPAMGPKYIILHVEYFDANLQRLFGVKFYPMTLKPALPIAFGMAYWYTCVQGIDKAYRESQGTL